MTQAFRCCTAYKLACNCTSYSYLIWTQVLPAVPSSTPFIQERSRKSKIKPETRMANQSCRIPQLKVVDNSVQSEIIIQVQLVASHSHTATQHDAPSLFPVQRSCFHVSHRFYYLSSQRSCSLANMLGNGCHLNPEQR